MNEIKTFLDSIGYISTALVLASVITGVVLWFMGITPALFRLGRGLSGRKIAIFAKGDMLTSLIALLEDSKLFWPENIIGIAANGDVGKAEIASVFLVSWSDWGESINEILSHKTDGTALVVYATPGSIQPADMELLNSKRNVTVTNFRGRLLNDLVVSMITTSYEKK